MLDLNKLKNHSIIICPANIKDALVAIKSKDYIVKDFKFITKQELKKNTYFSYDVKSIHYIHKKYNYNYDLAEVILDNLHNILLCKLNVKKTGIFLSHIFMISRSICYFFLLPF